MAYAVLEVGDLLVFAMEHVEGEDLARLVKVRGPLPVLNACYYAQQVAAGLQQAFEKGMVHRDIKPSNLLLARQGKRHVVKIIDFGLARVARETEGTVHDLTRTGQLLGTPEYIAPEQAEDATRADIRADIYSLGCTLYFLLTGKPPFQARSLLGLLQAHQTTEATALDQLRPDVPAQLREVVAKMMAKDPAQRYQKPVEVAQALAPFVKAGPRTLPPAEGARDTPARPAPSDRKTDVRKGSPDTVKKPAVVPATKKGKGTITGGKTKAGGRRIGRGMLLVGLAGLLVAGAIGLWAAGMIRLKTAEGILVVEVNEPNPDVYVDGDKMTVTWGPDGKTAEIRLKAGTRKVEVKKDGFTVVGEQVELQEGKRRVLTATLVSQASAALPGPGGAKPLATPREPSTAPAGIGAPLTGGGEKPLATPREPSTGKSKPQPADAGLVARVRDVCGIELVSIPAGEFYMGSKDDDKDAKDGEKPRHKVRISRSFYLGKYMVTYRQFQRFVEASSYQTGAEKAGDPLTWKKTAAEQTDDNPVVEVSWNDANAFCQWLAKEIGAEVRLPREAEWEYSCRAGTTTNYYFGDNKADLGVYAWYADNARNPYGPHPCGLKKPNDFGLYDMHGNVWEWCADDPRTYKDQEETDPDGGTSFHRALRGGSFDSLAHNCRAAYRTGSAPSDHDGAIGFRVLVSR
jgi:formylglycine-generating enzyme required for sulfatase activity